MPVLSHTTANARLRTERYGLDTGHGQESAARHLSPINKETDLLLETNVHTYTVIGGSRYCPLP